MIYFLFYLALLVTVCAAVCIGQYISWGALRAEEERRQYIIDQLAALTDSRKHAGS